MRKALKVRETAETKISLELNLDGKGEAKIEKKYMEKVYFSKVKRGFCIRIGSWNLELRWPWGREENESSIEEEIWRSPAGGKISVSQMMYEGYECQESEYTEGEMEEKLRDGLKRKLESEIQDEDIVILNEEFKVEKIKEGMKATLEVEMMKNIGISVESKTRTGEE